MADHCSQCGVEAGPDDAFCRQCGSTLAGESAAMEAASIHARHPERPSADDRRRLMVVGVSFLVALIGFVFVTRAQSDAGAPAADLTPTADPPTITEAATAPIAWTERFSQPDSTPLAIVEIDGSRFVYSTKSIGAWRLGVEPVRVHRIDPEGEATDLGWLIDDKVAVGAIAETTDGVIAAGRGAGGALTLWRSDDGIDWRAEVVPTDEPLRAESVVEHEGITAITTERLTIHDVVDAEIERRFGDLETFHWQGNTDDGSAAIVVGPLGLVVDEIAFTGLEFADVDALSGVALPGPTWTLDAGVWTEHPGAPQHAALTAGPGYPIRRTGFGDGAWASDAFIDGEWVPSPSDDDVWELQIWSEGAVGVTYVERLAFIDPEDGPDDRGLFAGKPDRAFSAVGTGPTGVLATTTSYTPGEEPPTRSVRTFRSGHTLIVRDQRIVSIDNGEETLLLLDQVPPSRTSSRIDLDAPVPNVTFLDPKTGDELVTFTLAELVDLHTATAREYLAPSQTIEAMFTPDGTTWFGGPAGETAVSMGVEPVVHVGANRLILAVPRSFSGGQIGFTLLEAPLPDQ